MMKKMTVFLVLVLAVSLLAGCAGTPVVYYSDCTCPTGSHAAVEDTVPETQPAAAVAGALKTGLYLTASTAGSTDASLDANGENVNGQGKYDVTVVAVLVDDNGVIRDCVIDGISAYIGFSNSGELSAELTAPQTKNELGEGYNMKTWGGAIAEWNEQAAAFADYITGMTVDEVKGIAVDESTKPTDADLVSSVTIAIGGFIPAVEAAVSNAQYLGAQGGDTLQLVATTAVDSSVSATAEKEGSAQLDVNVAALTVKENVITSCVIDAVQAKVAFDAQGQITSELTDHVLTKNELGENYNMKTWGGAIAEWNEQAAAFAAYITGKTPEEVAGIAVDEATKPTDADLTASVTISIGGFQTLIAKACQ